MNSHHIHNERGSISGYAVNAEYLIPAYEAIQSPDVFAHVMDFLPKQPSRVIEIGAGTGRDAAWLASQNHQLIAVEPVAQFREAGRLLHPSASIQWVDDCLPFLPHIFERQETFDLVLLVSVWQHLMPEERPASMASLSKLLSSNGRIIMSIRHGPGSPDRECFPATALETIDLASQNGLNVLAQRSAESVQEKNRLAGVTWTWLVFSNH